MVDLRKEQEHRNAKQKADEDRIDWNHHRDITQTRNDDDADHIDRAEDADVNQVANESALIFLLHKRSLMEAVPDFRGERSARFAFAVFIVSFGIHEVVDFKAPT